MCSIMGFSKKTRSREEILPYFARTRSRGPDMSRIVETPSGYLCFHRLAIMDLSEDGMQPFSLDGDYVVCNGEASGPFAGSWRASIPSTATVTARSFCPCSMSTAFPCFPGWTRSLLSSSTIP